MAYEACRIALEHMIPVILLSDGYIANGSEPWKYPNIKNLVKFNLNYLKENEDFLPYQRNAKTLARKWAIPGLKGHEHRIGGLEKENISVNNGPVTNAKGVKKIKKKLILDKKISFFSII